MQRLAVGAGIAAALVLVTVGCAAQAPGPASTPSQSPGSTATPSGAAALDLEQFTPAPEGVVDEDTGATISPHAVPTWDAASRASAVQAAQVAMAAFARPTLGFDTWWAELSPLLTQQAQQDYAYVDPANVPATAVTGPGVVLEETSGYVASVQVPTDVGTYTLVLTRADAQSRWLASRFTPPDGLG